MVITGHLFMLLERNAMPGLRPISERQVSTVTGAIAAIEQAGSPDRFCQDCRHENY